MWAATVLGDDGWSLEVAIPWADMGEAPEPGQVVGFNVCRDRYLGANKQWMNWSQTAANFHDPDRFGHAVLSPDAHRLGELEAEYRRGGRDGAIVFLGPPALVEASYRALVSHALVGAGELLDGMQDALAPPWRATRVRSRSWRAASASTATSWRASPTRSRMRRRSTPTPGTR